MAQGKLQNEDFKTEAQITGAGGTASQLLNDSKIWITADGINKTLDDAIVDGDLGGGTALGIKNFLLDKGDAELGATTGWSVYADAAGPSPVDGTGGSPTSTWTAESGSPLDGDYSFRFTTAGSAGQGVSIDFSIDAAYKAKVLKIEFDYILNIVSEFVGGDPTDRTSAGDSTVTVWVYDKTNAVLIQPSTHRLYSNSGTIADRFSAYFQTASNSTEYRLILHQGRADIGWELDVDNVVVTPSTYVYGTPVTDWQSCTITGSWVSNTTYTGWRRRVGDTMECRATLSLTGTPTNTELTVNLPSGFAIDTSKISTTDNVAQLGSGKLFDSGTGSWHATVFYNSTTSVSVRALLASGTYAQTAGLSTTVPFTWASGDNVDIVFSVPISGWSSSVQMSDSADTRVVAARAVRSATQSIVTTALTKVQLNLVTFDTHGGFDTVTNNRYIVPVAGYYRVTGAAYGTGVTAGQSWQVAVLRNGTIISTDVNVAYSFNEGLGQCSDVVYCNAGDYLELHVLSGDGNYTVSNNQTATYLSIERISGPSAIAATATIAAIYESNAGQSITNNTTTIINFEDKVNDTHGAVTTGASWKFTAPAPGFYQVSATATINSAGWNATESFQLLVAKNGTNVWQLADHRLEATNTDLQGASGSGLVYLQSGDYVDVRIYQNSGGTVSLSTTAARVRCSIHRVGL